METRCPVHLESLRKEEEFEDKITVQNRAGTSYIYSLSDMDMATNKSYAIQFALAVYAYSMATNKSYVIRFALAVYAYGCKI